MRNLQGQFTEENTGSSNSKWLGDNVGYFGLHSWIQRKLGKAIVCEKCGKKDKCHWANKSRKYKRDVSDFMSLCPQCHKEYDAKCSKEDMNLMRLLYKEGFSQRTLARLFHIDQSTVSYIINRRKDKALIYG